MKVEYLPSFIKDLKALKGSPVYGRIKTLAFDDFPKVKKLDDMRHVKKLKAEANAYPIRLGDYRIGFFW